jgi:hypothetical protein
MSESPVTKSELKVELQNLRLEFKGDLQSLQTRLLDHTERVRIDLLERTEKVETTLLKEFRKWGVSFESRFKANDALVFGFNERLISVEERLSALEQK